MYARQQNVETDRELIDAVISENPFATVIYQEAGETQNFHIPLVQEAGKLIGHLAKANPAWARLAESPVLIIFHGPHCYISPSWYGTSKRVPTWSYVAVQVRGQVAIHHDEGFLRKALTLLGQKQDPALDMEENISDNGQLLAAIVGIEISVTQVFAKFKLDQGNTQEERKNVIEILEKSADTMERAVAMAMKRRQGD